MILVRYLKTKFTDLSSRMESEKQQIIIKNKTLNEKIITLFPQVFSVKVYMTEFFICSIKSPQCADKCSKKIFSIAIFLPRVASNFTSGGVQNRDTKNRRLGTIVTSIQDSKLREKQISQSFSNCELINLQRNGTIVRK